MAAVHKHLTLMLLHVGSKVLLGLKKKGFGAGKLNGFGGKVEPYETVLQGAVREMQEECGLLVADPEHVANLRFTFESSMEVLHVYVFRATMYSGELQESEEMAPAWFDSDAPPLDRMWLDDKHWLPLVLAGKKCTGDFHFRGHETIDKFTLAIIGDEDKEGLGVDTPSTMPVTEVQGAITS